MDGQTIEQDPRTAEALRQKEVFKRAMAQLERDKRRREAAGYAVLAAAYSFEPAARDEGRPAKMVHVAKLVLIAAAGLIPNYLVWSLLLS
ncbi:hypothetical protein [Roseovarius aestuariivivens]|uniref:hypothetical protein n=1 Tax=Roseovarius aestuariivivens TaxID=1888910 RepID=UPI0010804396|nr:hypothetical protein [Roseovarius aestuariivivens]